MFSSCRAARGRKTEDRVASSVVRKISIGENYEGRTRLMRSDISRFSGGTGNGFREAAFIMDALPPMVIVSLRTCTLS